MPDPSFQPLPPNPLPTALAVDFVGVPQQDGSTLDLVMFVFSTPQGTSHFFVNYEANKKMCKGVLGVIDGPQLEIARSVPDPSMQNLLRQHGIR